jgi:hypothetical protein
MRIPHAPSANDKRALIPGEVTAVGKEPKPAARPSPAVESPVNVPTSRRHLADQEAERELNYPRPAPAYPPAAASAHLPPDAPARPPAPRSDAPFQLSEPEPIPDSSLDLGHSLPYIAPRGTSSPAGHAPYHPPAPATQHRQSHQHQHHPQAHQPAQPTYYPAPPAAQAAPAPAPFHKTDFDPDFEPEPPNFEPETEFELVIEDDGSAATPGASPAILKGLKEIEEYHKDRRDYSLASLDRIPIIRRYRGSKPASWVYSQWRGSISGVLKLLKFVDDWAYLISIPFLFLMVFGIVTTTRGLVHAGAIGVVLTNYGRFWADIISLFVRPFKEGPAQGLAFLFPPYTIYYLIRHWDRMRPILARLVTSCIPIVLVILVYSFVPSVNPGVENAHGITDRLELGKEELDRVIQKGFDKIGGEISGEAKEK